MSRYDLTRKQRRELFSGVSYEFHTEIYIALRKGFDEAKTVSDKYRIKSREESWWRGWTLMDWVYLILSPLIITVALLIIGIILLIAMIVGPFAAVPDVRVGPPRWDNTAWRDSRGHDVGR